MTREKKSSEKDVEIEIKRELSSLEPNDLFGLSSAFKHWLAFRLYNAGRQLAEQPQHATFHAHLVSIDFRRYVDSFWKELETHNTEWANRHSFSPPFCDEWLRNILLLEWLGVSKSPKKKSRSHLDLKNIMSLDHLLKVIRSASERLPMWINGICSHPHLVEHHVLPGANPELFFANNTNPSHPRRPFGLYVPEELSGKAHAGPLALMALYPTGALRSIPAVFEWTKGGLEVTPSNDWFSLDPNQEIYGVTGDVPKMSVLIFAVVCEGSTYGKQ